MARRSLEELLADYQDFLRTRGPEVWGKDHRKAVFIRKLSNGTDATYETYRKYTESAKANTAANAIVCLIHQTNYLLDGPIRMLEVAFVNEAGLRERMTRARLEHRKREKE